MFMECGRLRHVNLDSKFREYRKDSWQIERSPSSSDLWRRGRLPRFSSTIGGPTSRSPPARSLVDCECSDGDAIRLCTGRYTSEHSGQSEDNSDRARAFRLRISVDARRNIAERGDECSSIGWRRSRLELRQERLRRGNRQARFQSTVRRVRDS